MDVLLSIFGLAASIVQKARQVSANKGACLQLSERVQKLNEHLEKLRSNQESDLSQQVVDNLGGLESTLQSIDAFLEEQSGRSAIVQFFMSTATKEKLATLHERIDRHMLDFQLTFVEITIAELDAEKAERGEIKATLEKLLAEVQGLGEDVTDLRRSVNRKIAAKDKKQAAATSQEGSSQQEQQQQQREHEFFWLLDPKDLEYETKKNGVRKILGKGGFSIVYSGTYMGQPVAIKTLFDDVKQFQSTFVGEVRVQYPLRHPNIVRLYGALYPRGGAKKKSIAGGQDDDDDDDDEEEEEYALIFERCQRTLLDIIADQQHTVSLSTAQKHKISTGIVSGIVYLHNASPKVIHRDLKPHNVMLDGKLTAKLTDFGLAATRQSTMATRGANASSTVAGYTDAYAPPEVLSSQAAVVDERCDVYSLGITLYELWMGHPAWGTGTNVADLVTKGERPEFDCPIPPYVRSVIEACWAQRLEDRPHSCSVMAALISQQHIVGGNGSVTVPINVRPSSAQRTHNDGDNVVAVSASHGEPMLTRPAFMIPLDDPDGDDTSITAYWVPEKRRVGVMVAALLTGLAALQMTIMFYVASNGQAIDDRSTKECDPTCSGVHREDVMLIMIIIFDLLFCVEIGFSFALFRHARPLIRAQQIIAVILALWNFAFTINLIAGLDFSYTNGRSGGLFVVYMILFSLSFIVALIPIEFARRCKLLFYPVEAQERRGFFVRLGSEVNFTCAQLVRHEYDRASLDVSLFFTDGFEIRLNKVSEPDYDRFLHGFILGNNN